MRTAEPGRRGCTIFAVTTRTHRYDVSLEWQGNRGTGTSGYRDYGRTHEVRAAGKPAIPASSDVVFRGEPERWNPEELLVAALSQCHLLTYLHMAAVAGVVVTAYTDAAEGTMVEEDDGGGQFTQVILRPQVVVADESMVERAMALHADAEAKCFVARSVNFPVHHEPKVVVQSASAPRG
jgi:organic hydroperoxide reductase OsmC/OhrA